MRFTACWRLRCGTELARACAELDHEFWADDISLRDDGIADFARVHGRNQITDLYLLALAVKHGGTLVTLIVPSDNAPAIAAASSSGLVALVQVGS